MNANISLPEQPCLTWLDVERKLRESSKNYTYFANSKINRINCFYDGCEIEFFGEENDVETWIHSIFKNDWLSEEKSIKLAIANQSFPLQLIKTESTSKSKDKNAYPLWRDQTYAQSSTNSYPEEFDSGPPIISFHSFKGGVGRTTALLTYVSAIVNLNTEDNIKILIVDADLEAPGISYLLDNSNKPSVSFVSFLEALHYPPKDVESSINFFSDELKKTSIDINGARRELFVLPAASNLKQIMDMSVQPQHLTKNIDNPWIIGNHINSLGKKLGADIILIDLRAGFSELSSPIIFDPRIEHFFVTTISPQSVSGTVETLKTLNNFQKNLSAINKSQAKPNLIISLLTEQLKKLPEYDDAFQKINESFINEENTEPSNFDSLVTGNINFIEANFNSELMSLSDIYQALKLLQASSLYDYASRWAMALIENSQKSNIQPELVRIL